MPRAKRTERYVNDADEIANDVCYKYFPVSVFEVERMGKLFMRGVQSTAVSSRLSFSPFPRDVAEWVARYFLRNRHDVFDPYAGWGERHAACVADGKRYTGYDLSPSAIDHAQVHYNVTNLLRDSRDAPIPSCDAIFTCPPYFDIEKFDGDGLHRIKTWAEFLRSYEAVWKRCVEQLQPGGRVCVVVGDWRKNHVFYDFTFQTEAIFNRMGLVPFDKVILSHKRQAPLKAMIYQTKRLGYACKVHQTLLVYDKPRQ